LAFENPNPGTRVEYLSFERSPTMVSASGSGNLEVIDCDFTEGAIHIASASSGALSIQVEGCLMVNPTLFGIDASGGRVNASGNTITGAGDCGIRIRNGGDLSVQRNLIVDYANFGIACPGGNSLVDSACNDIYDTTDAEHYLNCLEPVFDFHLDPLFCPTDSAAWFLQETSPCNGANSGLDCSNAQIGARGVGCFPQ
jgi:hypothetical protein